MIKIPQFAKDTVRHGMKNRRYCSYKDQIRGLQILKNDYLNYKTAKQILDFHSSKDKTDVQKSLWGGEKFANYLKQKLKK